MRPRTPAYPFRLTMTFGVEGVRLKGELVERLTGRPPVVKEKKEKPS